MKGNNILGEFIELCRKCAQSCGQCPEKCSKEGCGSSCQLECKNCHAVCDELVQNYFQNKPISKEDIENCRKACNSCADECEKNNCQHCIQCARDCRKCSEKAALIII